MADDTWTTDTWPSKQCGDDTPTRDNCCERLHSQGQQLHGVISDLLGGIGSAVADQGKQLGKVIRRLERVATDSLNKSDKLLRSVVQSLATSAQSRVSEQAVRLNLVRGQLEAGRVSIGVKDDGPIKSAQPSTAESTADAVPGNATASDIGTAEDDGSAGIGERKRPDDAPPGETCGAKTPPSQRDVITVQPWGVNRGDDAGLHSEWGQIQLAEAASKHEPVGPYLSAYCQPDPLGVIEAMSRKPGREIGWPTAKVRKGTE